MPPTDLFERASEFLNEIHASYRKKGQGPIAILRTLKNLHAVEDGTGFPEESEYIRSIRKQLERVLVESFEASNLPIAPGANGPLQSVLLVALSCAPIADIPGLLATLLKFEEISFEFATEIFTQFGPAMQREWGFIGDISECVSRVLPIVGNEILRAPFRDIALCALWQTPQESRATLLGQWAESASEVGDLEKELTTNNCNRELDGLLTRKPMNENEARRVAKFSEILLDSSHLDADSIGLERLTQLFRNLIVISPAAAGQLYANAVRKNEKLSCLMHRIVLYLIESSAQSLEDEIGPSTESCGKFISAVVNEFHSKPYSGASRSSYNAIIKELNDAIPRSLKTAESREARDIAKEEDVFADWGPRNRLYGFLESASPASLNSIVTTLNRRNVPLGVLRRELRDRWADPRHLPQCESQADYSQLLQVCSKLNMELTDFFELAKIKMLMSISQNPDAISAVDASAIDRILEVLCDYRYLNESDVPKLKGYVQHRIVKSDDADIISLLRVMGTTFGTGDVGEIWPSVVGYFRKATPTAKNITKLLTMLGSVHGVELPPMAEQNSEVEESELVSQSPSRFEGQVFQTARQISGLTVNWRPDFGTTGIGPNFLCKMGGSEFILEAYSPYQYIDNNVTGELRAWDAFRERYFKSLGFTVVSVNTREWDRTPPERRKSLLIAKFPSFV